MATQKSPEQLLAEIESLRAQLGIANAEKTAAQEMAAAMAEATAFGGNAEERATGKTINMNVCLNPWVTKEKEQKFKDVEMPTYYYTIDLPAGAGLYLLTNNMQFFHGETYEVEGAVLADLKSRVARCWDHERAIHSENENAYRKPQAVHLKSAAAIQRGY